MILHQTQKIVAKDNHDYRVVCCGRQWGKTTLAVQEMIAVAFAKSGREIAYFATTYDQARNIAWSMLKEATKTIWSKPPNESRLELFIDTQDGGTSKINLRGFENIETARGQQFDFLVIDEVAQLRNWKYTWDAILEPTLAFRHGKALFISTPQGFNHFHELYIRGQANDQFYKSWHFTSYENPYLPKARIEQAKKTNTENYFAQEYLADFRKYTGLVYKEFDREIHVINPFDIPDNWSFYRGIDFGSTNPTACLWIAVDGDDNWFVVNEHYEIGQTIDYHAGRINSISNKPIQSTFGDPTGAQWISEFAQRGIYITPANKEVRQSFEGWVRFGIDKVAQKLKVVAGHIIGGLPSPQKNSVFIQKTNSMGMPSLFMFATCNSTIREFETYRWKERKEGQEDLNAPEQPEKAMDHCLDALRYFAVSYKKPEPVYIPPKDAIENRNWRLT